MTDKNEFAAQGKVMTAGEADAAEVLADASELLAGASAVMTDASAAVVSAAEVVADAAVAVATQDAIEHKGNVPGKADARALSEIERDQIIGRLIDRDIAEAKSLLAQGEDKLWDWLRRRLRENVPYNKVSNTVLAALTKVKLG